MHSTPFITSTTYYTYTVYHINYILYLYFPYISITPIYINIHPLISTNYLSF